MASSMLVVQRGEPELVTPSETTPYELKYLSDLDNQAFLRLMVPGIHFYRKNEAMKGKDPVEIIKQAIAKTLVYYYPFAGRQREGPSGELLVECTGEGVLFIEANANVTFDHFAHPLLPPFEALDDLLYDVPGSNAVLNSPLMLVQVTRLRCGGFIFAHRTNHTMCDASGFSQFLNAIGETAQGASIPSVNPVWSRELLRARDRPHAASLRINNHEVPTDISDVVHQSYFFGPAEMSALRNHVPSDHLRSYSSFEIVTACMWRCRVLALGLMDVNEKVRLVFIVNARSKLDPPLPVGYYGNAFTFSTVEVKAHILCENNLGYALELVKKAKEKVTDKYIRSGLDYMVQTGGGSGVPKTNPWRTFSVSDVRGAGFGEVDFGWGKPVYGGPAVRNIHASFYLPAKINEGGNGLVATVSLPGPVAERMAMELQKLIKFVPAP